MMTVAFPQTTNTLIIGASIAGLASAACLRRKDIDFIIIEKHSRIANPWHSHYDRLHLHTSKRLSNLPYKKFGKMIPRYPDRQQVIDYLEDYRCEFGIEPLVNTEALSVRKDGDRWITETTNGIFVSKNVIRATGALGKPKAIRFLGMEGFPGKILHSCEYKTGKDFTGQRVLVAGFGNSACEIAIDLYEQGAVPAMAVRGAVNVIPRDVFGVPVQALSLLLRRLPPRVADMISAPLMKWLVGDLGKLGLKKSAYGPLEQIRLEGKAPVLDIGTIALIRRGDIAIYGDIDQIAGRVVRFKDGKKDEFDAIIAAIGYEDLRVPAERQHQFGKDGLYFCGYWISPTGQIREIGLDAKKIAADIAKK
jgi:indole-3-pyruvate monooxygenase